MPLIHKTLWLVKEAMVEVGGGGQNIIIIIIIIMSLFNEEHTFGKTNLP